MIPLGWLLIVAAVAVLAWLAGTRRRPTPLLDHPDRVVDERTRTAMAALTPDALDAGPDYGVAAGATAYLRDLATGGPVIPIIPDPRTREE